MTSMTSMTSMSSMSGMSNMSSGARDPLPPTEAPASLSGRADVDEPQASQPVELSAQRLHELALEAFRVGNRGRLSLCDALRVLAETRLHLELGFPSVAAYAAAFFHLRRAESFEYVRVAGKLVELTELRDAFATGRMGWSVLKAVTRVASIASQASWIEYVRRHGVERTLAEAQDALRRSRDAPRESSFGLPNLDQRLVLRFSRSDMDRVRRWLASACAQVAERTGADEVSPEQAILFLSERDVGFGVGTSGSARASSAAPRRDAGDGESAGGPGRDADARETADRPARVVYQRCPDCRRGRVATGDGFVEVAAEEIERHEGCAEQVVLDGPTPPRLRRRILAREADRCGNPRCHHRADQCHHIVFRSRGGKTDLTNEVAVCTTCHALIHAGLLRVRGRADEELCWLPAAFEGELGRPWRERTRADRLPVLRVARRTAGAGGRAGDVAGSAHAGIEKDGKPRSVARDARGVGESAAADSASDRAKPHGASVTHHAAESAGADSASDLDLEALASGLRRMGWPAGQARNKIEAAFRALPRDEHTEARVLHAAIASG